MKSININSLHKLVLILLCVLVILAMTGCGKGKHVSDENENRLSSDSTEISYADENNYGEEDNLDNVEAENGISNTTQEPSYETQSDNITEQPAATIKPIEKLDIVWLKSGIIPQESVELEIESEPGSMHRSKSTTTGTAILAQICEKIVDMGYEIEVKHYGLINDNGEKIFQNTYDYISYRDNELFLAGNNCGWNMKLGYIDRKGNEIIAFEYDDAANFSDGMAKVGKRDNTGKIKYGYIDSSGKEVVPCEYDEAANFSNGLASVAKYEEVLYGGNKYEELRYGFIDKTGKRIIPLKYCSTETHYVKNDCFENPIVKVSENGSDWGYIDTTGKVVIPLKYFDIAMYGEGLFRVIIDKEIGYIDAKGKEVIPFLPVEKYVYSRFSEGLVAKVKVKKKNWTVEGFFNQTGDLVVPLNNKWCSGINVNGSGVWLSSVWDCKYVNGLVKLVKNKKGGKEKWGFLDKNGMEVIPAEYDMADSFNDIVTRVGKGENMKYGALDQNGKIVIPIQYDEMTSFTEGLSVVGQRNDEEMKYGVFDTNGKMLIEMEHDEIYIINQGRYGYVRKGDEYGIFKNPYYEAS